MRACHAEYDRGSATENRPIEEKECDGAARESCHNNSSSSTTRNSCGYSTQGETHEGNSRQEIVVEDLLPSVAEKDPWYSKSLRSRSK